MKKTLIITLEFPPTIGGIATYIDQLCLSFPKESIILLAPNHLHGKEWDRTRTYSIVREKMLFPKYLWPRWLRLFFQVRRIVKKENIESIHLHHILPVGYVALLMKIFKKIPYLIFSHGTDIAAAGSKKWKRKMALLVALRSQQIITNSENLRLRLVNVFPELRDITSVLYPCPDKMFFDPPAEEEIQALRRQYALEGKKVILSVSRLVDGKGFPHLIRLLPDILKKMPHLVWFVVGDGPKKDQIIQQIQKNNLQNIVRFVGEVPHRDLKKYYHLADVFVLLTHPDEGREEGLGLVFLEAATAGLPVVAGRSGGVEEAVIDRQTGLIVDVQQNPESIVKAIVELLDNESYAKQLGDVGQERMRTQFQWEHQVKRIEKWL